ncbi:basic amino acid ABC transporter substrate-binding protein [Salidesulfovibrio onnuriiensis]|uniref:basic amino acid ABC transporter substrate-binding protein n=1 Tax=Salidesulfovibrio onnuriiensis TaxID=2583823 RepID=UPI00202B9DC3|nr:basic amino acid ABC transporter substrate-binding protein [Salidesulfovibrio onnuriiensis]
MLSALKRTFVVALMAVAVLATSQIASADMWDKIQKDGVIIIGNSPDYPPYETMDGNTRVGFDIDLMNAMAEKMGLKVEWKTMSFDSIIAAVNMGQVDVGFSGFGISEDRKKSVDFSKPYYISGQVIVTLPDSSIKNGADLVGKKVAVQLGTTGQEAAEKIEGVDVVKPETYSTAFMMLQTKAVDAVVSDIPVAEEYSKKQGFVIAPEKLSYEENAIVIPKGNPKLVEALNKALDEVEKDGTLGKLVEKWMK